METRSRVNDVLLRSDDIRMADMDISEDGETELYHVVWFCFCPKQEIASHSIKTLSCLFFIFSEDFASPEPAAIEEDEAEQELQKQLEKQRKLRQKQMLKDSGERVSVIEEC